MHVLPRCELKPRMGLRLAGFDYAARMIYEIDYKGARFADVDEAVWKAV